MSTSTPAFRFSAVSAFAQIDASAGIVRGVSVITEGPALGHGMEVDATTVQQVMECAKEYRGGLKVKMTHGGDAGDIVGFLTDFRIDEPKLLADLHLLETTPHRAYILELAAKIPDTFGLSISFSGPVEERDGMVFARCTEIYSADLVAEPAANPTGLFSADAAADKVTAQAGNSKPKPNMDEAKIKEIVEGALSAALAPLSARLSKLENPAASEKKDGEMASAEKGAELAAQNALKLFAAQFGTPPAPASAPAKDVTKSEEKPKTFEELVRSHAEYSKNKAQAIKDTIAKHTKEHAEYQARLRSGKDVILF
jgi:hypothetical protein